jgi:hypothetical protein
MFQIVRDTREQEPFLFLGYPVEVVEGALNAGDYSIPGFTDRVAVERKSLSDLVGCLTTGRDRFTRELERLRGYESAVVVVESGYNDLAAGRYRSKLNPASALQSIVSMMQAYRMPFFFAGTRPNAERFAFDFLRHYYRHAEARYRAIQSMGDTGHNTTVETGDNGNTGEIRHAKR